MQPAVTVSYIKSAHCFLCVSQRTSTITVVCIYSLYLVGGVMPRVLAHLSLALNRAVFRGEPMDPDMQNRSFEYQQRVSMARDC